MSHRRLTEAEWSGRVLLATANPAKVHWLRAGLEPVVAHGARLEPVAGLDVEESGETCAENARLKALAVPLARPDIVVAEDSGLEVDALGGFPGPKVARWTGGDDDRGAALLLEQLEGRPRAERGAQFLSAVVVRLPDRDVRTHVGTARGTIAEAAAGDRSDGYDRVFRPEGWTGTIAEAGRDRFAATDHRRQALAAAAATIVAWLGA